jgi:P-type E1-E2 ATPase
VDTVVLDKTGTLTLGKPKVLAIHPHGDIDAAALLETAANAERPSEHPLAHAIIERARRASLATLEPARFESTPGGGIVAIVGGAEVIVGSLAFLIDRGVVVPDTAHSSSEHSRVLVARDRSYIGALDIADVLRTDARRAIAGLREMGMRTVLLTGDAERIARSVASELGVDDFAGELLPEGKLARVEELVGGGRSVAMVGDGINDAPALTRASVGIAMGSGTALTRETADVLLLGDNLTTLVDALVLARRCRRTIMQNFWGTVVVDGVGVLLAGFGMLDPLFAAFIHVASELAFILNSARLLRRAPGATQSPGAVAGAAVPAAVGTGECRSDSVHWQGGHGSTEFAHCQMIEVPLRGGDARVPE